MGPVFSWTRAGKFRFRSRSFVYAVQHYLFITGLLVLQIMLCFLFDAVVYLIDRSMAGYRETSTPRSSHLEFLPQFTVFCSVSSLIHLAKHYTCLESISACRLVYTNALYRFGDFVGLAVTSCLTVAGNKRANFIHPCMQEQED